MQISHPEGKACPMESDRARDLFGQMKPCWQGLMCLVVPELQITKKVSVAGTKGSKNDSRFLLNSLNRVLLFRPEGYLKNFTQNQAADHDCTAPGSCSKLPSGIPSIRV